MGIFNKVFNNEQQTSGRTTAERPSPKPTNEGKTPSMPKTKFNPDILRRAKEGDPVAQCKLGLKYKLDGYLVREMSAMLAADGTTMKDFENLYNPDITPEQAFAAAFEWLSKSAEQQYGPAEYYLAQMYLNGLGVEQSNEEYNRLMRESQKHAVIDLNRRDSKPLKKYSKNEIEAMIREVERGNAQAMYDLAWAIFQGNPVPEGVPSFEDGKSDEFSQYDDGLYMDPYEEDRRYKSNLEIENERNMKSLIKGIDLLKMASLKGHAAAAQDYNFLSMDQYVSKYGNFESRNYENDSSNRQSWIAKNCASMDPAILCMVALYEQSRLTKYCSASEPYNVLMMAANRGYSNAYLIVASWFRSGYLDEFMNDEAYPYERRDRYYEKNVRDKKYEEMFKKAVEMNNSDAMMDLAFFYMENNSDKKDEEFKLVERAAKLGNARGMFNLAQCYQGGIGTQKSDKKAIEWYTKAAQAGYPEASMYLSMDYGIQFKTKEQEEKERDEAEYDNRFWR